jgi:hypothetical protein
MTWEPPEMKTQETRKQAYFDEAVDLCEEVWLNSKKKNDLILSSIHILLCPQVFKGRESIFLWM